MTTNLIEQARAEFEDRVFNRRFMASITRNPNPPKGTGALDFISDGCPTKAELCARDEKDDYIDPAVSAMWWGWKEALAAALEQRGEAQQARPQPLPDHEIVTMYDEGPTCDADMIRFARAIERAHGIGGPNE